MVKNKVKPEFEDKLKDRPEKEIPSEQKKRHRRTRAEMDAEKKTDLYVVAPEQLELFKAVVKIPFDVWADSIKREEMRLTPEEAGRVSTPIAQLLNYYLPKISPVGYIWISFGLTTIGVMSVRMQLLAKLRREEKEKICSCPRPKPSLDSDNKCSVCRLKR